jgi:spore germination protein KA
LRLPQPIGQALNIVGILIIGESAVSAGLVAPATVIVIALTAVAVFALPMASLKAGFRLTRFGITLASGILGLAGTILGLSMVFAHLASLESWGLPYLAPLAPYSSQGYSDTLMVQPMWEREQRPTAVAEPEQRRRQDPLQGVEVRFAYTNEDRGE